MEKNMKTVFTVFLFSFCHFAVSKILNLEDLPSAVTAYNKQGKNRITSLENFDRYRLQIEGMLSTKQYMIKYKLNRKQFIKKVFGNIDHLPIENLSLAISEWNKQQTEGKSKIASMVKYHAYHNRIHGVLSADVYQVLYEINQVEFTKRVFGNQEYFLSLEKLPQNVEEYNARVPVNTRIFSYSAYIHHYTQIEGALSPKTYRILYNMKNINEFITFLFRSIEHVTPEELPQAIEQYHHKIKFSKIISLSSFGMYRGNIPGVLSFEIYTSLYEITQEEFENLLKKASGIKNLNAVEIERYNNSEEHPANEPPSHHKNNENTPLLTLEQTPKAIIEYNRRKVQDSGSSIGIINSWMDYKQYYGQIPGADSIENLERQYEKKYGTLKRFTTFLFQKPERTLTPIELSRAIANYNSTIDQMEQINDLEDYEIFYYRIIYAPTLEAFKQFAKENWNDLFQEKFGTIDNYVESILIKKSCELSLAS